LISVIICSRFKQLSSVLKHNIKETIGCDYELLVVDNSENNYSIFEAYNIGIEKSNFPFLCFIHEDISFDTLNWGINIIQLFEQDAKIGLIGIAGAKTKTKMPSAWWNCPKDHKVIYLKQRFNNQKTELWNCGFNENAVEEVAVIDGVLMAARKIDTIKFSSNLKGFHNYDLNISIEYAFHNFKIMVTNSILITHFSLGKIDASWINSTIQFDKLFKDKLPLNTNFTNLKKQEFKNGILFIELLIEHHHQKKAFFYWLQLFQIKPISKYHSLLLKKILSKI
jgi:hypothetical protein